jgi:AmmeMemoRadiSam system protein B
MNEVREPAVAGMFYPDDTDELKSNINSHLDAAVLEKKYTNVFGVVSPHAGYPYSGLSAAYAYNVLKNLEFETAVILSPSHREYFRGNSIYSGDAYKTPLGELLVDTALAEEMSEINDHMLLSEKGHGIEHAVEVQLPFLQMIKDGVKILPIVIGDQNRIYIDALAEALSKIMNENRVIITSTDLSHFHSKSDADYFDTIIEKHIANFEHDALQSDLEKRACEACGGGGIVAMMKAAELCGYTKADVLSRTDSGDVSGDNSSVVGYLSAVIYK